jgi:hypothetical protein
MLITAPPPPPKKNTRENYISLFQEEKIRAPIYISYISRNRSQKLEN